MTLTQQLLTEANEFHRVGDLPRAERIYRQILAADPQNAEAWGLLGIIAQQSGQSAVAVELFRRAIAANSNNPAYYSNLGIAYMSLGQLVEATECQKHAVELAPRLTEAHFNLGFTLQERELWDEAAASYQCALEIEPDYLEARNNLGDLLAQQGRLTEALEHYEHCLRLDPQNAIPRWNRAIAWLKLGNYEQGWPEFELRFHVENTRPPCFSVPLWDGSPLQGETVLLYAEQGMGDVFQFARYANLVKARGARVALACPQTSGQLLENCRGVDELILDLEKLPRIDFYAPLLSLPHIFGTTSESVPASVPYLSADAGLVKSWQLKLSSIVGYRVGICWQGSKGNPYNRHRDFPLSAFAALAAIPEVRLVSLQMGHGADQMADAPFETINLGDDLDSVGAFTDTAAVMQNLDLIISADTAPCHLAGALGRPVWVPLPFVHDWRWISGRDDSPWYPTMRLFRQTKAREWGEVFQRMAGELGNLVGSR